MKLISLSSTNLLSLKSCLMLTCLIFSSASLAGSFYKWVDEEGNVNYGERPPEHVSNSDTNVQKIKTDSAPSKGEERSDRPSTSNSPRGNTESEVEKNLAEANEKIEERKKEMKKNCATARKNLEVLTSHGRVKETGLDGEQRYLTDEEHKSRVVQSTKFIDENCKDFKPEE